MDKKTILILLLTGLILGGCSLDKGAAPLVSFTSPPDGVSLPLGSHVILGISSTESNDIGVVRVEVYVNGEYHKTEASLTGAVSSFNANIAWEPPRPGEFNIMAIAYAADDTASSPATLRLTITGDDSSEVEEPTDDVNSKETETPSENSPEATENSGVQNPYCGDGYCGTGEDCANCPNDCGNCCGNGICDNGETSFTCVADCPLLTFTICGDGNCDEGEGFLSCPADCPLQIITVCGDGVCNGNENVFNCFDDCAVPTPFCGDGNCDYDNGENAMTCTYDCGY